MSLYQKYRPKTFHDVVGHELVTTMLKKQVTKGITPHAYLFIGPSGVGKTTIARILAQAINCDHPRGGEPCYRCQGCQNASWGILEFNSASYRGIDAMREMIIGASYMAISKYKVYLMDEVHMLTMEAWNAILKLLEEPPPHLKIILCTTDAERIPETVQSRCQVFHLPHLSVPAVIRKLEHISKHERMELPQSSIRFIAEMALGNLRQAENMLEQSRMLNHGKPDRRHLRQFFQAKLV